MPEGACQEQIDRAAARHPGVTNVDVACTVRACDRKGGTGTVAVTLANGATVGETFAYTGDPAPIPVPACTGMALDVCRSHGLAGARSAVGVASGSIPGHPRLLHAGSQPGFHRDPRHRSTTQ